MIIRKLHPNGDREEEVNPSLDEAMALFEGTEWEIEQMLEAELRDKGEKTLSPGMSFSTLRREVVTVFPNAEGLNICFEFPNRRKRFGIFPPRKGSAFLRVAGFPVQRLQEVISAHYDGEQEVIRNLLLSLGRKVRKFTNV